MIRVGLISDTHGFFHQRIKHYFNDCDQIWHAGDIGSLEVIYELEKIAPVKAVYGNIDNNNIRKSTQENLIFTVEDIKVCITHIAGYPTKYNQHAKKLLSYHKPKLFICGHSHILKIQYDQEFNHLFINPGAAGNHGWHKILTLVKFEINDDKIENMRVIELGSRGKVESND